MKISIVTISYNQAKFIERTINSVIQQDYKNKEYIIVDPGSTDGSRKIIERYSDYFEHIIFEPDAGPADGLNQGFAKATGDVWGYINADDKYLTGTFDKVIRCFEQYPDRDVISAHAHVIDDEDNMLHRVFSHPFSLTSYAAWCCFIMQQSTFFRPNIFKKIGGFNKFNHICWDGELMVDYALAGAKFKVIRDYWGCFRVYAECITGSVGYREKLDVEHERIRNKIILGGYKPLPRPIEWLCVRMRDPLSTLDRIIDGLSNSDRKI